MADEFKAFKLFFVYKSRDKFTAEASRKGNDYQRADKRTQRAKCEPSPGAEGISGGNFQWFSRNDFYNRLKGTDKGEESLFLLGMSAYKARDYEASGNFFKKYFQTYTKGLYTEDARYYNAMSLYNSIPEPKLDQTGTYEAVTAFQNLLDLYPTGIYAKESQDKIFKLQDRLVEKEYLSAKTYFDLGSYFGNCSYGGSNYEACIITAENALREYPYTSRREEFAIMILRAKYQLALHSIKAKELERMEATTEEYYAFANEFPESKYLDEAKAIFDNATKRTKKITKE